MPRNWSKAVPEGNGPVLHQDEFGPDQTTMADLYRIIIKRFDKSDKQFDELIEKTRETNQRLAGLEHEARQSRLAQEVDVKPDTKTDKRTEDAEEADREISGDSSSAQADSDPMCLTSFGDDSTKPLAPPCCRDNALVDKGAAALKPCLSPVEVRALRAAGGLLPHRYSFYSDDNYISPIAFFSWGLRETRKSTSSTNN